MWSRMWAGNRPQISAHFYFNNSSATAPIEHQEDHVRSHVCVPSMSTQPTERCIHRWSCFSALDGQKARPRQSTQHPEAGSDSYSVWQGFTLRSEVIIRKWENRQHYWEAGRWLYTVWLPLDRMTYKNNLEGYYLTSKGYKIKLLHSPPASPRLPSPLIF